jgi:hypothetical protein
VLADPRDAGDTLTARELGARIVQAVQTHVGNHPQFDDIALVCFGRGVTETEESPSIQVA